MKFIVAFVLLLSIHTMQAQTKTEQIAKTDSTIYYSPEIKAEYSGGIAAWYHYLSINVRYPVKAFDHRIQGTVVIQFIVEADSSVHDFKVLSGPPQLQAESIRVISKSGLWIPAKQNGKEVTSYFVQPISFTMEGF
jgi:protein TonB